MLLKNRFSKYARLKKMRFLFINRETIKMRIYQTATRVKSSINRLWHKSMIIKIDLKFRRQNKFKKFKNKNKNKKKRGKALYPSNLQGMSL